MGDDDWSTEAPAVKATERYAAGYTDSRCVFGSTDPVPLSVSEAWERIDRQWEPAEAERRALAPFARIRRWLRERRGR